MLLAQVSFDQVWTSLAAAGPLALVLGVAVYALWKANKEERDRHAAQEATDRISFVATLEAHRTAFTVALEAQRTAHLQTEEREFARHATAEDKIRDELSDIMTKLTDELWARRMKP